MTYTVTKLITEAYHSSSLVSRQFEQVQGYQLNAGLQWLNEIILDKVTDNGDLPYINVYYPLNLTAGVESYFIPGLIDIQEITFYIGSVRYQMEYFSRHQFFGTNRANNINALPLAYTYERQFGGATLYVYFFPQNNYPVTITGNFYPGTVQLNQDLTSKVTIANLGLPIVNGAGTLLAQQLVINTFDLMGAYANIAALIAAINANVVGVNAYLNNFQLNLQSITNQAINITSTGNSTPTNNVTFANFSTISGPITQNFFYTAYDQFYIDYLRYDLADRICKEFNMDSPPGVREQLDKYKLQISKMAEPMDLRCRKISGLSRATGINYAQVNIGQGWVTS